VSVGGEDETPIQSVRQEGNGGGNGNNGGETGNYRPANGNGNGKGGSTNAAHIAASPPPLLQLLVVCLWVVAVTCSVTSPSHLGPRCSLPHKLRTLS
jgi:hypothetical protein